MPQYRKTWTDDRELIEEILGGSTEHFEMLYRAYFPRVYRFALKRLGDPGEAEDVTQEVFFTVFNALKSFQGNSTLLVWIFGITRNKVNRRFRKPRPFLEPAERPTLDVAVGTVENRVPVGFDGLCGNIEHSIEVCLGDGKDLRSRRGSVSALCQPVSLGPLASAAPRAAQEDRRSDQRHDPRLHRLPPRLP